MLISVSEYQENSTMTNNFITVNQAAERAGVCKHTIWRWIKSGIIDAIRPRGTQRYWIDRSMFENFLTTGVFQ